MDPNNKNLNDPDESQESLELEELISDLMGLPETVPNRALVHTLTDPNVSAYDTNENQLPRDIEENLQKIDTLRRDSIDQNLRRLHGITTPSRHDSLEEELSKIHGHLEVSAMNAITKFFKTIEGECPSPILQTPTASPKPMTGQAKDVHDYRFKTYTSVDDDRPSTSRGLVPGRLGIKRRLKSVDEEVVPDIPLKMVALDEEVLPPEPETAEEDPEAENFQFIFAESDSDLSEESPDTF